MSYPGPNVFAFIMAFILIRLPPSLLTNEFHFIFILLLLTFTYLCIFFLIFILNLLPPSLLTNVFVFSLAFTLIR